jgi:virulence factor Mce-like protein
MLTRFIKAQLAIFTVASIIGIVVMVLAYLQLPTLLGIGRIAVKLELPNTGGLYQFSNVTYRGVQIGKVTEVHATRAGAEATMSLASSPKIPADLQARVLSVSAVGEQYVDLLPKTDTGPYLRDEHDRPAAGGADARPGGCAPQQHSERQADSPSRRGVQGPQRIRR